MANNKWIDVTGAITADSVYCDGILAARDAEIILPDVEWKTVTLPMMGDTDIPIWGVLGGNLEMEIKTNGRDYNTSLLSKPGTRKIDVVLVSDRFRADGTSYKLVYRIYLTALPLNIPDVSATIGNAPESTIKYTLLRYHLDVYSKGDGSENGCTLLIDRTTGQVSVRDQTGLHEIGDEITKYL